MQKPALWLRSVVYVESRQGHTLLTVIEDFTNEVGIGNVYDDAELAIAERAACDVDVEDAPGAQERGAVGASELTAGRWIRVLLSVC